MGSRTTHHSERRSRAQWAVCAHRGAAAGRPPGTLEAFQRAAEAGSDYVEFDVRRLRDGSLAAFHDPAVGGRVLSGMTFDELRRAAGYEVPPVEEVLAALAGHTRAHVDLKETGYEAEVIALAELTLGAGGYVVTSLEDETIAAMKRDFPHVRAGLSLGRDLAGTGPVTRLRVRLSELFPGRRLRACGADFVSANHRLARLHVLRTARHMRLPVFIWTVNDERSVARLCRDPMVECIVTDEPEKLFRLRAQMRLDLLRSE